MQRIWAQLRKELIQLRRDRIALAMAVLLPAILMTLLGTAISLDVENIPITVQDLDQTPLSRQYLDSFRASLTFRIVPGYGDSSPERALLENRARAVLIIPEHFERRLWRKEQADVQLLVDATDANTANVLRGSARALTLAFVQQLQASQPGDGDVLPQIRLWYNPGRSDASFIGPGALCVVLALLPPLLASLAMSRETESKTILQVYVSGVSAFQFLMGKVLAYVLVAAADWLLLMLIAYAYFGLRLQGDPTSLLAGTFCFIFCIMSFGTLVGSKSQSQATSIQAMQMAGFILSFLLSGFVYPVSNIPASLRWLSAITPARYYIEIVRDAFLRGGGWSANWVAVVALAALGFFFFALAWRGMRPMQISS